MIIHKRKKSSTNQTKNPLPAYWAGNQFWRGFWFSETEGKAH